MARTIAYTNPCPAWSRRLLESMVHHESAILRWSAMEWLGEREGPLDAISTHLRHPLLPMG
jgi:hypothetical protein